MLVNSSATITPERATQIIRDAGVQIGTETLRAGIEQGIFPFGVCIEANKRIFIISKKKLAEWLADFCGTTVDFSNE